MDQTLERLRECFLFALTAEEQSTLSCFTLGATLAKQQGIRVCVKAIGLSELPFIEEAFITSSSRPLGSMPMV